VHAQHRQGCEARITGDPERAIITVNSRRLRRRRRSSIGHELGHWQHHRGRILVCRANDIGRGRRNASPAERTADSYAADLLLPAYLFKPVARAYPKLDFATVQVIADIFDASYTATAIRLVETGHAYALLVCHGREGRKWFTSTPGVADRWFPRKDLDNESSAPDVLSGRAGDDAGLRRSAPTPGSTASKRPATRCSNRQSRKALMKSSPSSSLAMKRCWKTPNLFRRDAADWIACPVEELQLATQRQDQSRGHRGLSWPRIARMFR
jgi:hypothetical protein